jgi:glycosyltransferase involved in cell wall biosynthesis
MIDAGGTSEGAAGLVCAVVPTFNEPDRLRRAVESIRAQTFEDWQALVIDDGSEPRHQARLGAHLAEMDDPRIRLILSPRNRGPAQARNTGIRLSRARYIAFLDGDDVWVPEKLERQLAAMRASEAYLSCTAYRNLTEEGVELSRVVPQERLDYSLLLRHNVIGCSTVMLDTARGGKTYFPDLPMRQDFAHWLAVLRAGRGGLGIAEPLTTRYVHRASLSRNKLRAARHTWAVYRQVEKLSFPQSLRIFAVYALKGLARTRGKPGRSPIAPTAQSPYDCHRKPLNPQIQNAENTPRRSKPRR